MYFNASDSITRFYEVSTYGQRTFTKDRDGDGQADIFDVSVNFPTANTCDYIRVARDIIPLLAARGINLSDWNIVMLILPSNTRCAFAGASWGEDNQDGQTSWATIDGRYCYAKKTAAHELGHTMAMGHADYDFGDDSASTTEYGDSQCIMGNVGSYVQFNAPHRVLKGWVPQNKILQLEHSGSYTISSLDRDPSSSALPSVLTFPRYDGAMYYISYREPGPFNALPYSEDFVNLHYATDSRSHTYLIESFNIPGKSYTTRTGPEVKVESLGDGTATVTVTGCIRHAPSFGISPSTLRTKPKSAYQYSFTLFNRDSVECAPRSFEFTCESDLAFLCSSTFDTPPVLSPGGAASGTLTLTPQS
jgi:hypothetical protein